MRIVVADDSMLIRLQFKKFFEEEMNYEVVGLASDGEAAVELFKKLKPDLIVVDLAMPNKTGYEALSEIMKVDSNARVIICSATKDPAMITYALNCGAKSFIKKPLEFTKKSYVKGLKGDITEALNSTLS